MSEAEKMLAGLARKLNDNLIEGLFDADQSDFQFNKVLRDSGLLALLEAGQAMRAAMLITSSMQQVLIGQAWDAAWEAMRKAVRP